MHTINPPKTELDNNFIKYNEKDIQNRASSVYQTHKSPLVSKIYRTSLVLLKSVEKGIYWGLVAVSKGERGAGGVSKKYAILKAAGWFALDLLLLPVCATAYVTKTIFRPGKGKDTVSFMDATKGDLKDYKPPVLGENERIHLASYNVAAMKRFASGAMDVLPSKKRMEAFADWINGQEEEDLPLALGLQEAFDMEASEVFTNKIRERYPYAVTNAGLSETPLIGFSSGLEFHSRVPIKSAAFFPFDDLKGFHAKMTARGFLRLELDLGAGKSALVYVTHTQPYVSPKMQEIRKREIELISDQMRYDRYMDSKNGETRGGHYYLMGDLNVGNVEDEKILDQESKFGLMNEYNNLREEGQVLNDASFYDPFLEEHFADCTRKKGKPMFLEKDVDNLTREKMGYFPISEPKGSFYFGAGQKDRTDGGYGSKHFYSKEHHAINNCRYDYILRLNHQEDYKNGSDFPKVKGKAEIRHVLPKNAKIKTTAVSDHLLISAIFEKPISPPAGHLN